MSNQTKPLTAEILKDLLPDAMIYRGIASTMDVEETGFYQVGSSTMDVPSIMYPYGVLEVFHTSSFVIQRFTTHENSVRFGDCGIWVRTKFSSQPFTSWRQYPFV